MPKAKTINTKILIVEDDIALRNVYETRFKLEGYDVMIAGDGEEGLSIAVKEKPDVVVLDLMMPKISGMDVLDILKSTPETKKIPVLILTALTQESVKTKGFVFGANEFMVKSESKLEEIVEKVKSMLKGSK
jgi:DNA-binding response OmpR family regulator